MRQVSLNGVRQFAQLGLLAMMLIGAYQASAHELPEGEARYLGNEGVMVSVACAMNTEQPLTQQDPIYLQVQPQAFHS